MKKTQWLVVPAIALALLAAGCGNDKSKDSTSSKTKQTTKASSTAASSSKAASTSTKATAASSSKAATPSAASSTAKAPVSRLTSLNQQLKTALPGALLPSTYPTNATLNASYTGNSSHYAIYYNPGSTALAFNSSQVGDNAAAIKLTKQTYATAQAAEAQINYQPVDAANASVDIGDNLKAEQQGAAGSTYLTWQEGRWSITVQAINQFHEDPLPLAKQATALFSKFALPIPAGHGAVTLRVNTGNLRLNTIAWRSGNILYTASGTDAMTLLTVATSLK